MAALDIRKKLHLSTRKGSVIPDLPEVILRREKTGREYVLRTLVSLIGSDRKTDIYLKGSDINPVNAAILYKNGRWMIANDMTLDSVRLNDITVHPGERLLLNTGNVISIGPTEKLTVVRCVGDAEEEKSYANDARGITGWNKPARFADMI